MIMIDSHSHTRYSFDSTAEPESMILEAIEKGIKNLCFTEHIDIDESNADIDFSGKFSDYFCELRKLREKYEHKIDITIGLEAGFGDYCQKIERIINSFPFEYIINSIHAKNGLDYCSRERYLTKQKTDVYDEYLQTVLDSLDAPYRYDAVGHLGYPSRFSPFENNAFCYANHKTLFDKILKTIIKKEKILEVNTSVYKSEHSSLASEEMLKNYYELGGRRITFSSDAHAPQKLGRGYTEAIAKLKQIGFTYLTKSKNGNIEQLPI